MKIPVKITPDRIRDSIVQVYFQSSIPFEALIGIFYTTLDQIGWKYMNRSQHIAQVNNLSIDFSNGAPYFFSKDKVRLQLVPGYSVAFNCTPQYIGWHEYSKYIDEVLSNICKTGYIESFTQIGIRYISEFANIDIFEKVKMKVEFPYLSDKISNSSHRINIIEGDLTKTINIASKLPAKKSLTENKQVQFISILDIDVVKKKLTISNSAETKREIDRLHSVEKELFFGLLTDEFINSLNPQYD